MLCPRCKLALKKVDYEGVEVDMCDACWGMWLDSGELEEVLKNRKFTFSPEEKEKILSLQAGATKGPTSPAPCPRCTRTMERFHYDSRVHLVIDRCVEHGVWLDTGEIKKVQALAEHSREVHRILLKKLGLIAQA